MSKQVLEQTLYCSDCYMAVGVRWVDAHNQAVIRRIIDYAEACICASTD